MQSSGDFSGDYHYNVIYIIMTLPLQFCWSRRSHIIKSTMTTACFWNHSRRNRQVQRQQGQESFVRRRQRKFHLLSSQVAALHLLPLLPLIPTPSPCPTCACLAPTFTPPKPCPSLHPGIRTVFTFPPTLANWPSSLVTPEDRMAQALTLLETAPACWEASMLENLAMQMTPRHLVSILQVLRC